MAVVDDGAVCADAGQPGRGLALDANAAIVGDVESVPIATRPSEKASSPSTFRSGS